MQMLDLDSCLVRFLLLLFRSQGQIFWVSLVEQEHKVVGQVTTADRDLRDEVRQRIAFIDGNRMRYALTCIDNSARCSSSCKERQHSLVAHVKSLNLQVLEPK